jgi:hypothetical protein
MKRAARTAPDIPGQFDAPDIVPARRLAGMVVATLIADGPGIATRSVASLDIDFEGAAGDRHRGLTRAAGSREPWHPRGTVMRNERQLSIVSPDELDEIAAALAIPDLGPEWLGANLLFAGVPRLSWLPPRTRLFFAGGAVLAVEGQNAPCRLAGASIAARHPGRTDIPLAFPRVAKRLRGLVAWVERPGAIAVGEPVSVRTPEQWLYA